MRTCQNYYCSNYLKSWDLNHHSSCPHCKSHFFDTRDKTLVGDASVATEDVSGRNKRACTEKDVCGLKDPSASVATHKKLRSVQE
jgi:hypothetical protein